MPYIHILPPTPSFDTKGLFGYTFGPLQQKDLEIYYIEVEKGHDTFMVSKRIARVYYVISGSGSFTINDCRYDVTGGMLVEVPPKVEYSYSGKMKLIGFCTPRWFYGNDRHTKWNPDVIHEDLPMIANAKSWKIFGRHLIDFCLRFSGRLREKLSYLLSQSSR
jgi:mannose-6-phosphate isomerase-like protein (cupin superfamily)